MLTDDAPDPRFETTRMLAEAMVQHGLTGRGVACHARALGHYPDDRQAAVLELVRRAGLGLVSDPHTGSVALPGTSASTRSAIDPRRARRSARSSSFLSLIHS